FSSSAASQPELSSLSLHDALPISESGVELMNAILDVAVEVLPETLMIGSVAVINPPAAEFTPASHSYTGIWILTSLVGFVIGLRSEEHTSELQSRFDLVCRLLLAI